MNCPYCREEISEQALVCKVCRRDLQLVNTLQVRINELESRMELSAVTEMQLGVEGIAPVSPPNKERSWPIEIVKPLLICEIPVLLFQAVALSTKLAIAYLFAGLASVPIILLGLWFGNRQVIRWSGAALTALLLAFTSLLSAVLYRSFRSRLIDFEPDHLSLLWIFGNRYSWLLIYLPPAAVFLSSFWLGSLFSSGQEVIIEPRSLRSNF